MDGRGSWRENVFVERLWRSVTPTGRAMWQMIGVLAELEHSLITERTRAGVKDAKRRGVKFGRKPKRTPDRLALARKLIDHDDKTPTQAAKIMGVSRSTVYRALQRAAA
jgi:DNA invertase Pin-like site-specific DNA recombinase